MRKRVVSVITWPLRFLRGLLALLLRPLRKRDKAAKPATPQEAVKPAKQPKQPKPPKPPKPGKAPKPGKEPKPGKKPKPDSPEKGKRSRLKANPLKKLTGLRGKPRIAAIAVVGIVAVVAVLSLRPGPDSQKEVSATLARYAKATSDKDYQTLCDSLFSRNIVDGLRSAGLPCEVALSSSTLKDLRNPQLTVLGVEVTGDHAAARARTSATGEVASVDTIRLVREDGNWRIDSLAEPGSGPAGAGVP
jgi:type IV secretory pathway VirB10-like protein